MGVHDGHRERLKARYLEHGLDNFNDINVLELLLFYAIPRADTNLIAHELLNRFGSLSGVLEASIQELQNVSGIGENSALLLSLIPQVSRRYMIDKTKPQKKINSASAAGKYFMPIFMYERDEVLYMLCLDSQKCVICCQLISRGVVNSVEANVRKMTELALRWLLHVEGLTSVICGASKLEQIQENIGYFREEALDSRCIDGCEAAWELISGHYFNYHR